MTPDADHQELRFLLGPYLLGGLDGADRDRLERHLASCPECAEELSRLAPIPGLLSRARDQALSSEPEPALAPDFLPRLVHAAVRARARRRRRTVLTTLAAAAVVAVVVVAAGLLGAGPFGGASGPEEPEPTLVTLRAPGGQEATGTENATGSARLTPKAWGTELTLQLERMPSEGPFRLEVTGESGARQVAATWGTTPTAEAVVSGAASLATEQVRRVRVLGPDGPVLEGGPGLG